jgi:branched-chain amino acid transport system ATP-binding protein
VGEGVTPSLLRVESLTKRFGGVLAIDGVEFELREGEAVGIIGPNGSGKTTLINVITGFVKPTSGRILYRGRDVTGRAPHRLVSLGIARTFQTPRPFLRLPAYRNLTVPLYSRRSRSAGAGRWGERDTVAMDLLEDVGFERDSSVPFKPAAALPHGYLKRLELARCIALQSELLIADELFSGLSVAEASSLVPVVEKLRVGGMTLLMVEHRLRELFRLVDRVIVLQEGKKIAEGRPDQIIEDVAVKAAYLGAEAVA